MILMTALRLCLPGRLKACKPPTSGRMAGNKFMEYVDARKGENYEELARGNDILGYSERCEKISGGNTVLWGCQGDLQAMVRSHNAL